MGVMENKMETTIMGYLGSIKMCVCGLVPGQQGGLAKRQAAHHLDLSSAQRSFL